MGRRKVELSEAELAERKRRYWGEDFNRRRQERYAQDAEYRAKARAQTRETYLREQAKLGRVVEWDDCRENLGNLGAFGIVRDVAIQGVQVPMLTFTAEEMSNALKRNIQVLYRWIKTSMFPKAEVMARYKNNRLQAVYTEPEVRALLAVFGEHMASSQYYKTFHTETRDRLFAVAQEQREKLMGGEYGAYVRADGAAAPAAA
jgi:hypothetical protein